MVEIYHAKSSTIINTLHMEFKMLLDKLNKSHVEKLKVVDEKETTLKKLREKESGMQALNVNLPSFK